MRTHTMQTPVPDSVVRRSEVLAGLSFALDLTEGQRPGHSVRSCLIGMRIADAMGLPLDQRTSLFYALLMKDLGSSSNSARFAARFGWRDQDLKANLKLVNWSQALESFRFVARNVLPGQFFLKRTWRMLAVMARGPEGARDVAQARCERGSDIAQMMGLSPQTAAAIRSLDEHWDGLGQPYSEKGDDIPLLARILGLAQTAEAFFSTYDVETAYDIAAARRRTWFDPAVVDAFFSFRSDTAFWTDLGSDHNLSTLVAPDAHKMVAGDDELDRYANGFALVVDAKSPWTYQHSNNVADIAVAIGERIGFAPQELRSLRRAGLLHDLGKLGVSSLILDKPGKLTDDEFHAIQQHPRDTAIILGRVSCFRSLVGDAAAHHERLDGRGYYQGLEASKISVAARVLAVADVYDALRSSRPYRAGLPAERILEIMNRDSGPGLDPDCLIALTDVLNGDTSCGLTTSTPAADVVKALKDDYQQAA
jgi:HD-GYP domain-containing protein (c-di-GMP phosphodiesterase class II)